MVMSYSVDEFRCSVCGAPIDVSPYSVVVVCGYCGWSSSVESAGLKPLVVPPEDRGFLRAWLEKIVRSKAGKIATVRDVRFLMVPVWVVYVNASTRYNGYRTETRSRRVGTGKYARIQTYDVYVPVKGVIDEKLAIAVYGRRFESTFGIGTVKSSVLDRVRSAVELEPSLTKGWDVLGSEFSQEEVLEAAKTRVADEHRRRLESMTTKLYDCYTTADVAGARLILYPVLEARYESGGKSYRMIIDGVKGSTRVLKAELPITTSARIIRGLAAAAVVFAAALLASLLQPLIGMEIPEELQLAMTVAPPAIAGFAGFLGSMMATAVQRISKTVEEIDIRVLG